MSLTILLVFITSEIFLGRIFLSLRNSFSLIIFNVLLMGVEKARFRNPVIPDCDLLLKIEAIRSHGRVWKYKGEAFVNDKKMADAIWSATIVDKK